jgi:hypothetical protein
MKSILILSIWLVPVALFGQGIGLKAGINFANITNASQINSSSQSGFTAGVFLAPPSQGIISSRTELNYSRQGYSYSTGNTSGKVNLDYLVIPQFMAINITHFVQLQFGIQMAFLLNAKADSTASSSPGSPATPIPGIMSYYNTFDYGFGAGAEIHPVAGLVIGGRYNLSLGKLYKEAQSGQVPSFSASDAKNNLVQLYAGWIFGGSQKKKNPPQPNNNNK